MYYKTSADQIRENIQNRIDEDTARVKALKAVKVDTSHKILTNRAISGQNARIGDYISIGKALYVPYQIEYKNGHRRYESETVTAYSYTDENGQELGVDGYQRISRTITPEELAIQLEIIINAISATIKEHKAEYKKADSIAKKQSDLIDKINAFDNSLSYASKAKIGAQR